MRRTMNYYAEYDAGRITIEELRQHQANDMPRCANHPGRPAYCYDDDDMPMCHECIIPWAIRHQKGEVNVKW